MLSEFINSRRDEIMCRANVDARSQDLRNFLKQLMDALRSGTIGKADISRSASRHGHRLFRRGFSISRLVGDYGNICQTITVLAIETNAPVACDDFRRLNCCLEQAVASAVTTYLRDSASE